MFSSMRAFLRQFLTTSNSHCLCTRLSQKFAFFYVTFYFCHFSSWFWYQNDPLLILQNRMWFSMGASYHPGQLQIALFRHFLTLGAVGTHHEDFTERYRAFPFMRKSLQVNYPFRPILHAERNSVSLRNTRTSAHKENDF